jgi:hypothetical protein
MKSLLLGICIAAIATPASARPWAAFYCGKVQVALIPGKYFDPTSGNCKSMCDGQTHYFDLKNDPEHKRPLSNVRTTRNGDMFFNGKKCREFKEKEYDSL